MKKYIFGKMFRFEDYPKILICHKESNRLSDLMYDIEAEYEDGECPKEKWDKAIDKAINYDRDVFARVIYDEFKNKDIIIMDRRTKAKENFDDHFSGDFESLSNDQKNELVAIVNDIWGWKLPAEYYNKKEKILL